MLEKKIFITMPADAAATTDTTICALVVPAMAILNASQTAVTPPVTAHNQATTALVVVVVVLI